MVISGSSYLLLMAILLAVFARNTCHITCGLVLPRLFPRSVVKKEGFGLFAGIERQRVLHFSVNDLRHVLLISF